jgi:uncharacterized protein (TIGR02996 family)
MYPEADALLDAVFDHPDDDTPRLVYADWLQEHGQEDYARFIRLSIQARGAQSPDEWKRRNSERKPFWKRMVAVRHDAYRHTPISLHDYERGLCNAVTTHGDTFLRTVESWWPAITPRELTIYGMRGFGTRGIETEIVAAVGRRLPWLRGLRCLSRPDNSVQDVEENYFPPLSGSVFASLAETGILPRLRSLRVTVASLDVTALSTFANSALALQLKSVSIGVQLPSGACERISVQEKAEPNAVRLATEAFLARHG